MAALIAYYMAARIQGDCYNFERMKINIDIAIREQFARQTMKEMPRQAKSFIWKIETFSHFIYWGTHFMLASFGRLNI